MKNMKRAVRRHQKLMKFKKRLELWVCEYKDGRERREEKQKSIEGKTLTFLRTTIRPCNCYGCSCRKYKREQKQYIIKKELLK